MRYSKLFVCEDTAYSTYEKNVPAPIFRKKFNLYQLPTRAEIMICGLGFYDLFVNGQKITKGYLAPYISNPDHYVYYDLYDFKSLLHTGENVIGIMLGDGFIVGKTSVWSFKDNSTNTAPMVALHAEIDCGKKKLSFEADSFVCKKGPILFNDLRSGVFYDARLEELGWDNSGFVEEGWHPPIIAPTPHGQARLCEVEPIMPYRAIAPVSIVKGGRMPYRCSEQVTDFLNSFTPFESPAEMTGGYIFDFGENNAGIYQLRIKGERGQKISIQCAEQLVDGKIDYSNINFFPDGFCQRDIYILKGDEDGEFFEPMFTYHGFRYLYVTGITKKQAKKELLTFMAMSSAMYECSRFHCSDETANALYEMTCRSDRSNFYYFPTDCPHREKNGWTGDASLSVEHMLLNLSAEKSLKEWLYNIRAAQREDGSIPAIVPTVNWGYDTGPAWDNVLFNLPYYIYRLRGDTEVITQNADAMLRYLSYLSRQRDSRGLVHKGLGDWLPVGKEAGDYPAPNGLLLSILSYDLCTKATYMFEQVKLPLHAQFAHKLGMQFRTAVRSKYIDLKTCMAASESQTAQAMAIYYGIFKPDEMQKAFDCLMSILERDQYNITSGILGLRVIFHVLSQFGQSELAYRMITKPDYPSYGYWVQKGETTLLEHFNEYDGYYETSKNHHFLGDISNWLMTYVGGLKIISPGMVCIEPHFIKDISHCHTIYHSPYGIINIAWRRKDDQIYLKVDTTGKMAYVLSDKLPENVKFIQKGDNDAYRYCLLGY